jgi:RND family efflux transporter MFP subunit
MSGTLTHVHVAAGDKVEEGDLVAQVDTRDVLAALDAARSQVEAAQSAYSKAQLDVQRLERLYAEDLIARNRLERARVEFAGRKNALEQARTQVRLQQTNLEYARIRAPFAGVVSEVPVDQGSFVGPGTTLVVLEDRSALRIDAPVSAHTAQTIRGNNPGFLVKSPSTDQHYSASFQDIIPSMKEGGIGQILRLQLKAHGAIQPGEVVEIAINMPLQNDIETELNPKQLPTCIPRSALIHQGQLTSVMLVEINSSHKNTATVHKRWIITASSETRPQAGEASEPLVKVIQGLNSGEVVVLNPPSSLADGDKVTFAAESE